jgi:hypothetical protein
MVGRCRWIRWLRLTMEELGEDVEFLPPQTNTILDI